jgi:uncharacterized protein
MTAGSNLLRLLVALAGALWLACAAAAQAQAYPPAPAGPVYDGAEMLSPEAEAALDQKLRDYNRETGRALIVATVPDMGGAPIESYANGLFNVWGIGGEKRDQGLLLLIAREERDVRIEVGYGLHPYFGGIMAGRVIRDVIGPRLTDGDFDGGVTAGIDAIIAHLARSPAEAAAIEEAARAAEAQRAQSGADDGFPFGVLIWLAFLLFFFVLPAIARGGRRYRGRGGSGFGQAVGNVLLWTAVNAAMNSGRSSGGWGGGGGGSWGGGGGGGGFGGFGGGMSGGGGASGSW